MDGDGGRRAEDASPNSHPAQPQHFPFSYPRTRSTNQQTNFAFVRRCEGCHNKPTDGGGGYFNPEGMAVAFEEAQQLQMVQQVRRREGRREGEERGGVGRREEEGKKRREAGGRGERRGGD